jgi:ABC-2 type transport system ATP-binding protein
VTTSQTTDTRSVISVKDLGIEFYRSRRRRMQLREMLFHGRSGAPRETFNIYLTAGLHGLTKEQVDESFEEMVEFAGPEVRAGLDMPYRHFSSGMKVRLGFAVITALDEPIILVDEVLAVGDRKFKEKCYQRMESLLAQGRTLFLVSHSERDLKRFSTRGLYLKRGTLMMDGPMEDVLDRYNHDLDATR